MYPDAFNLHVSCAIPGKDVFSLENLPGYKENRNSSFEWMYFLDTMLK